MTTHNRNAFVKSEYLNKDKVKVFIDLLSSHIMTANNFNHWYVDRKSKKTWACNSVFNAYENYRYPLIKKFRSNGSSDFESFRANSVVLSSLSGKLRSAYLNCKPGEKPTPKEASILLNQSQEILLWGGVAGSTKSGKKEGNYLWLETKYPNGTGLVTAYHNAEKVMLSDTPDLLTIGKNGIRSNAGFAKIYSLLFDNFIIYDSRVAATLGLFAIKCCQENGWDDIPEELNFNWMPAKESPKQSQAKRRNASNQGRILNKVNNEQQHAWANIRANWIFETIFEEGRRSGSSPFDEIKKRQDKIRALESAFFMIGYDLGDHSYL